MDFHFFNEAPSRGAVENLCYVSVFLFLAYCVVDAVSARQLVRKHAEYPLVGKPFPYAPKFIHNLLYAWKATELSQEGYEKNQNSAFQLIRNEGEMMVLPLSLLEEVSRLPSHIAEPTAALNQDLTGSFTGIDLILENRLHHSIVQRKLSPRLPLLLPRMEEAVSAAFSQYIPQSEDWTEFYPYDTFRYISARVGAEVIVGPAFCDNKEWLHVAVEYTENLFRTVVVLRCFPTWMHPIISRLLPSYWEGWRHLRKGKKLLAPKIQELLDKNNAGTWNPQDDKVEDLNVLSWLTGLAKGRDRSADTLGHVLVMVALAAVHTTLLRMVNVLYDVTGAGLEVELLDEIAAVVERGWHDNGNPYDALGKLDSVMRESQRLSPPTTLGMKRLFKESYTFQDGTHIRAGTYACMPVYAIENDPAKIPNPETFDGLRAYRAARESEAGSTDDHLFSSPGLNFLNFGYGKTACPGRFFASVVVKMVIVKALTDYEFKFLPGAERPKNITVHEFLFTWPWNKMLIRRKSKGACPF
ncbi:cytochrome P450 [Annulohypoxylon maeteangense]|uniref:cytochrome P450 n=1 Tax=Annulohypoxylon maeteangense TaxID=1927788 RepID=UPI002007DD02|nr:cytochrome P450 [Annulohypoxylon maeteangense]KAI0883799.1 cytochrome P450 [Annulohypoxylon maeteangense]